ncbi:uncharacterized protein LOC116499327 [Aythya fuligula]|uniref:Uncharacterized protein LOC116499327 n=1 Tax=Aythya fuligula TaxID=219594 RepID=A0A6J3E891_AYTFU|nr:uncharacterized protein LOC116499327 [Aythya fuligula]
MGSGRGGQAPAGSSATNFSWFFPRQQQSSDGAAHGQRRRPASALPAGACSSTVPSQGGGAAGEGLQGEEQAESWLRDEPAGHRQVPEGPHRRHRQLGCLRGLLPLPAPEAHGVRPQRPEVLALGGRRGEGKSPPAEKGVGDEGCEVSGTGAAPRHAGHLAAQPRAARGSCRTSRFFSHQHRRRTYPRLAVFDPFYIDFIYPHTQTRQKWGCSVSAAAGAQIFPSLQPLLWVWSKLGPPVPPPGTPSRTGEPQDRATGGPRSTGGAARGF